MENYPETFEEARKYRYGHMYDIQRTVEYQDWLCAHTVIYCGDWAWQCSRKNGHGPGGLYCKQHAKMVGGGT